MDCPFEVSLAHGDTCSFGSLIVAAHFGGAKDADEAPRLDYDPAVETAVALLRHMPYVVPFFTRVGIFRRLMETHPVKQNEVCVKIGRRARDMRSIPHPLNPILPSFSGHVPRFACQHSTRSPL